MALSVEEFFSIFPELSTGSNSSGFATLLGRLHVRKLEEGEVLIEEGMLPASLYFLVKGSLLSYLSRESRVIELGLINPGQYVGEISFIDGGPTTTTVRAVTNCELLELTREAYKSLLSSHPQIVSNLMRSISGLVIKRLCETDVLLFEGLVDLPDQQVLPRSVRSENIFKTLFHALNRN